MNSALNERLQTEADLCRNEGADDIANLLDETIAELAQLRAELETMFQATVSVLGDDEHRGHTTERTLELCRNAVVNYINNHPTKEAQNDN